MKKLLALLVAALAIHQIATAQTVVGRISGAVVDPSGAAVPGANITVRNEATGVDRKASTNESGYYVAPNLQPGTYTVAVEVQGFKRVAKTGSELVTDGRLTVDFILQVGDVSATVEVVEAAGETINTVSGEMSRTIDATQVQDLALNGRNYLQLATLIPGAVLLNDDQLSLTTSLNSNGAALNGNRPNTSNLSVDGAFNLDAGANGSQINNVGLDFIREVQVKTSNFSAEYGRQSGASINVVTRSGGSQFHGSLYEFLRNDKLDARNFFSPGKPTLRFNDFGWSLGGPILKGKLFFFGGQEWKYIRRYTDPTRRTLPTRAERRGDFSGRSGTLNLPGTTTAVPGRNISSLMTTDGRAIAKVFDRMEALATSYVDTPTANNTIYQLSNPFQVRQDVARIDYRLNSAHSLYARYMHDNYDVVDPLGSLVTSQLPTIPGRRLRPATSWQIAHTWMVSPHLFNEAKATASWHSQRVFMEGSDWMRDQYGFQFKELYTGGGRYSVGIPTVAVNGFSSFTAPTYYVSTSTDISATDGLTWIKGSHTMKAGFLITRNRKDANGRPPLTGSITFNASGNARSTGNAMADAFLGVFRTYSETEYDPLGFFRFSQFDGYVTDQWKATRRLNFEVGMRFQAILPAYATGNNLTNFDPSRYDPTKAVTVLPGGSIVPGAGNIYNGLIRAGDGVPEDQLGRIPDGRSPRVLSVPAGAPRGLYQPAYPFAPRFSFAWAPGSDGKTAVRGGFGMFYDRNDLTAIVQGPLASPPFAESVQYENGLLVDPTSGSATARGVISGVRPIDPRLKTPYTMNYSLSVQRQLRDGLFLETAYVGNVSHHLMRQSDINQPSWDSLIVNNALPATQRATTNYLRPYKGFAELPTRISDANGNYNALQVYLTRRKGWLTGTASYTFSKALTDASSNTEASEEPFDRHFNYGPASFDRRHAFVTTVNAKLPTFRNSAPWLRGVIGGWEFSATGRYQSGSYSTITSSTAVGTRRADYNGLAVELPAGERGPNRWFNTAAFLAPPVSRSGNTGPGIVEAPGLELWDASFRKQFRVKERFNLRFQADLFNALNKANFRSLNTTSTSIDFGTLTASGPGRKHSDGTPPRILMPMTRRTLLSTAAAPMLSGLGMRAAAVDKRPSILLISGWNYYNIGDVAITPGFLRLVQRHFPEARVTLLLASYPKELGEYYSRRFPELAIIPFRGFAAGQTLSPEMEAAFARADLLVLNSGMTLSYGYYGPEWERYIPRLLAFVKARELGVPYGIYGHSFDKIDSPADILYRDILGKASFVYTRDSESLKVLQSKGVRCPEMAFGPDSTFGFDLRDEKAAAEFLRRHELERGKFAAFIPRLDVNRFRKDGRENEHAAQTVAILERYVETAKEPVVLVHEVSKAIEPVKAMVYDKLSPAARRYVRYHPDYWMPDAAQAVYAEARLVVSMEMHSVILGLAAGTPSIHPYFTEAGLKQWMMRDIGAPEWLIDQDRNTAERIAGAMLDVYRDTPSARTKVQRAMNLVRRRQVETMAVVKRSALTHSRG